MRCEALYHSESPHIGSKTLVSSCSQSGRIDKSLEDWSPKLGWSRYEFRQVIVVPLCTFRVRRRRRFRKTRRWAGASPFRIGFSPSGSHQLRLAYKAHSQSTLLTIYR